MCNYSKGRLSVEFIMHNEVLWENVSDSQMKSEQKPVCTNPN